jgi:hypothetical protein
MKFTTIDKIVRSLLIQKRLPLHYYLEYAKYALDCLRELTFDSLRIVNTVILEIDEDGYYATLPCDYVDWTKVGFQAGQFVMPITQRDSINRLHNYSSQGDIINYGDPNSAALDFPFWPGYWMFQNIDDLGENIGRLYGYNTGISENTFKIIPERGQIQFSESIQSSCIVLEYISDGQTNDNASQVDPYAQSCIEAYIRWRTSRNSDVDRSPEGVAFVNARRIFRARKNELTLVQLRQILFSNYKLSQKN